MTATGNFHSDPDRGVGSGAVVRLRLLATSDLHAHLFPFNYYTDRPDDSVGLAGLAALIAGARAEASASLLFDNGDTLQGAPMGDAAHADLVPGGEPHPMIAAMNALGYDAATLGNHDFDFGIDYLSRCLDAAQFPVVMANARLGTCDALFRPGHVLLTRSVKDASGKTHVLRIGVTGAAPPQITKWGRLSLAGRLRMEGIVPAIAREAAVLRAKGADLVVALAHTGRGDDRADADAENAGRAVAALPDVDAVIAGHTHKVFPGPQHGEGLIGQTPLVQPGFWGSHLGVIDLALTQSAAEPDLPLDGADVITATKPDQAYRAWTVTDARAEVWPIQASRPAARAALKRSLRRYPALRAHLARGHRTTRAYVGRPLGRTAVPLETYFSMIGGCAATQLVADAQRAAAREVIAASAELSSLPLFSAVAPFKAGGRSGPNFYTDIAPGALLLRHAADLYLYPNGLTLLRATGAQVRDWLERVAAAFHEVSPDRDPEDAAQPLIDTSFACYNFDRLDGLDYCFDLRHPARTSADGQTLNDSPGRVYNLREASGRPLGDDDPCLIVTNSYRAGGGGNFHAAAEAEVVYSTPVSVRTVLAEHIARADRPLAPVPNRTFSFCPLGGVKVMIETGPGARAHAARAAALGLTPAGESPGGFDRFTFSI